MPMRTSLLVCAGTGVAVVATWVNANVPEMYMDEPFHVRQTQRYCEGDFHTWDPKITTFPGLYLFGLLLARFKHHVIGIPMTQACSTTSLRSLNTYLALFCFLLFYHIHTLLHPRPPSSRPPNSPIAVTAPAASLLTALLLATYPLHFFYTYLYYTDVGSTALILLTHYLTLRHSFLLAALSGTLAVLFRQTNAVWVTFLLFSALESHIQHLKSSTEPNTKPSSSPDASSQSQSQSPPPSSLPKPPQPKPTSRKSPQRAPKPHTPTNLLSETASETTAFLSGLWDHKATLIPTFLPLLLIPVAFTAFVVHNKGITVGDRQAHAPVKHYMQLQYFAAFTAAMTAPVLLHPATLATAAAAAGKAVQRRPLRSLLGVAAAAACSCAMVRYGTMVHPYLVADNRHYTFYVWRKWFECHWSCRYLLVPVYMYSWSELLRRLRGRCSRLWVLAYLVCTAATLVPAWLLEPRYFTVPYMLLMLHIPPPPKGQLAASVAVNLVVNAFTLYMFVKRPYKWADGSTARFMW